VVSISSQHRSRLKQKGSPLVSQLLVHDHTLASSSVNKEGLWAARRRREIRAPIADHPYTINYSVYSPQISVWDVSAVSFKLPPTP